MLIKALLVVLLISVVINLFYALYAMIKNDDQSPKMSKYLGRRLLISLITLLLIIITLGTGIIAFNTRPF